MTTALTAHLAEALPRGYVAAFRLLRDRDEAHEACQEAATRALEAGERYDARRPFYPWFHRILRNHCLDRLAHRKRQPSRGAGEEVVDGRLDDDGGDLPLVSTPPRGAEEALLAGERARRVLAAIDGLSAELRDVIELRHFQDLSYEAIAETLEIPMGTVMSRLYRARSKLREALGERREEGRP